MHNLCSCILCKREFKVQHFNNHFTRAHNSNRDSGKGTGKFLIKCSCTICKLVLPISNLSRHLLTHNENESKICPKCKINHIKDGIFCSRQCANGKIHSIETKQKISLSLSNRVYKKPLNLISKPEYSKISFCKICNKSIPNSILSTCSSKCLHQIRSNAGKKSASMLIKRSKQEIELFNLCKSVIPNVTHNIPIYNGWDADIILNDHKIAILWNGPWHYKQMPLNRHSLSQVQNRDSIKIRELLSIGWTTLVFEDRYYTPQTAFDTILYHLIRSGGPTRTSDLQIMSLMR